MFDYIVVGAGTAGCTLAARLTENPAANVLLMEAGPPSRTREIRIPALYPALLGSALDWNNRTGPQELLNGRKLAWPRGKVLGGGGAMDAMIHLRGCREDFDRWRDLGNTGWSFDDLEPLWSALPCGRARVAPNRLTEVFLEACGSCGIARYDDFAGPAEQGAGLYPVARANGLRWNAESGFLEPALKRGNLTVWTGVHATRIVVEGGRASAVEYEIKGSRHQAPAMREVILCAGSVGSPQLLMLSGIGPAAELERLNIAIKAASPEVGANLQDHLAAALRWSCREPVTLDGAGTLRNSLLYRARKQGPLESNLIEAGAFLKSSPGERVCDFEILFAPLYSLDQGIAPPAARHGFTLLAAWLAPSSRGTVTLASADPDAAPRIDPGYLSQRDDRQRLEEAAERARQIVAAEVFARYRGSAEAEMLEECAVSLHRGAGTCRMGVEESAVVDPSLRVRGVGNLRVADASIMPVLPRSAPSAAVMVVAEKAAQLIRES